MRTRPFSTHPGYVESILGLHRLHAMTLEGRTQTPEADALRDSLVAPWRTLTEAEEERINGLSADLYDLSDPPSVPRPDPDVLARVVEVFEARGRGEWDSALDLLRRSARSIEPALVSHLRATIWYLAGDQETAFLFARRAHELDPANVLDHVYYLNLLERLDFLAACREAAEILGGAADRPPIVVAMAGAIRSRELTEAAPGERVSRSRELIAILEPAFRRLDDRGPAEDSMYKTAHELLTSSLAACFERLGQPREAIRYLNLGLAETPDDPRLLVRRSILRYLSGDDATGDLRRATRLAPTVIAPFVYLAHDCVTRGRFDEALQTCDEGLRLATPDAVRALLLEWRGIAMFELGFPKDRVRSAFEDALRLAPDVRRIRQNLDVFEAMAANPAPRPAWHHPRRSDVLDVPPPEPAELYPAA